MVGQVRQMTQKKIVPCLDLDGGRVVKGIRFGRLRYAGDPVELACAYARDGADEVVLLDISATVEGRRTALFGVLEKVAGKVPVPLTVGGGITTVEEMEALLARGAARVAVNSAAVRDPGLLARAADRLGSGRLVLAVDARRCGPSAWEVVTHGGRRWAGVEAVEWAARGAELGAGEILLTSVDRDGTRAGFDLELTRAVAEAVDVPVTASGGAGGPGDFLEVLTTGGATGALAASLFHFGVLRVSELKEYLRSRGVPVGPGPGRAGPEGGC